MLSKGQKGSTLITMMAILVIAFFILLALKIAPIYMNHSKVLNSFTAIEQTEDIENQNTRYVQELINKRFNLNAIDYIEAVDVKISNRPAYLKLVVDYEVIKPIVNNLNALVKFHEEIEVTSRDE